MYKKKRRELEITFYYGLRTDIDIDIYISKIPFHETLRLCNYCIN